MVEWNATVQYFSDLLLPLSDRLMMAFVLLLLGLILGRIFGKLTQRICEEICMNDTLFRITGYRLAYEELTTLFVRYVVYLVFTILALNTLAITRWAIEILAAIALLGVFVSFLLALRDFLPNIFAGWRLQRGELVKEGDTVRVGDINGRVQKVELQHTILRTKKGDLIALPNRYLLRHPLHRKKRK